jgi:hypothetical protein
MKKVIRFIAILLAISTASAAELANIKQFILTAYEDPVVKSQDDKNAAVKKSYPGIPGIDDIEFEIRNTGFNDVDFRYTIKVSPRGFQETKTGNLYNEALIENKKAKRQYLLNLAIYNRYLTIIDLLEQKALKALYKDLLTLYDDRIKVMEKLSYSKDFQLEKLIKEEKDMSKETVFSLEIDKYITVLQQRAKVYLKDTSFIGFDTSDLVSIKTIINRIETTSFSLDTNNASLRLYRTRTDLAQSRFKMEKAQLHKFFDAISFLYDNGDRVDEYNRKYQGKSYNLNNAFAVELNFRIPNLTLASHQLNKYKADLLSEAENYEQVKEELSEKVRKDLADLHQLIAQYRYLSARINEVDAEASLKKFLQIEGIDPLVLLDIKENILKSQIDITWIKHGILRNYLYVIDNAGLLSARPIRNYLSENLEIIE